MSLTVAITAKPCHYCGSYHSTLCPRIEEIEYHGDGTVKRVRLRDASRCGQCGLRDGDHAVWCADSQYVSVLREDLRLAFDSHPMREDHTCPICERRESAAHYCWPREAARDRLRIAGLG